MRISIAVSSLTIALLGGASLGSSVLASVPVVPSIQVASSPDRTENAGNELSVAFTAAGMPAGQDATIWLVDSATHITITEIVAIGIPVKNGVNAATFHIPFSWHQSGRFHVKVVVTILDKQGLIAKQASSVGTGVIRIRSAVIWPYGGTVLSKGHGSWVTWSTESLIIADYFKIYLYNESLGYLELVAEDVDPSAGRYFWNVPNVTGSGFRILIDGFLLLEEDGHTFEDPSDLTQSELLRIR
jgi:hypothetical protein